MTSQVNPVAPRLRTWLRYSEIVTVTTAASGYGLYVFNLNGLFDPNQTGTGHQPRGYDQLSALYQRYRVLFTKWQVILQSNLSTSQALLGVQPSNSSGTGSFNDLMEQSYAVVAPMTGAKAAVINGGIDLAKLNGKTHTAYMADDTTQALTSANPGEILALNVGINDYLGSASYVVTVSLWYECEFSDPLQLNQS